MDEQLLTTREYAERIGVTQRTVQRWIKQGRLEAIQTGRSFKIPIETPKPAEALKPITEGDSLSADRDFLSTRQYADAYGISVQEVRNLIHEGKLTAEKHGGKFRIYSDTTEKGDKHAPEVPDDTPESNFPITDETQFDKSDLRQEFATLEEVERYAAKIPVPHKIIRNKRGLFRAVVLYGAPVTLAVQEDELDEDDELEWID